MATMSYNNLKKTGLVWGFLFAVVALCTVPVANAATGNAKNGEGIYNKRCWWCHGKKGGADGPAAKFLVPPPRDFSLGMYKYKGSGPKAETVRDEDLFNMITKGMPGTGMPSWEDVIKEQERWDLVAYIKSLTDLFGKAASPAENDYSKKVKSSKESIEKGKQAFQTAKCFECHGQNGKGDLVKKLKEDSGVRVWPRNLTKPWTFRGGHTAENIFNRVSNGIPNTPMPSFAADATSSGKLSEEDRWHVANYVMTLADPTSQTKDGETVVKGYQRNEMPKDENDAAWNEVQGTAFFMVPQIIQKERFFTPANDLVKVKAFYNEKEIAFLLEWDDRTKSIPGDAVAETIAWDGLSPDQIAIQTSVVTPAGSEKPYFGHGDASHAVSMMVWNAGTTTIPAAGRMVIYNGSGAKKDGDAAGAGFTSSGSYNAGTWKVIMKRKLATANKDKDTQFEVGKFVPIAFANWDGSNGEAGSKHTLTAWYWLLLQPPTGKEVVLVPLFVLIALVGGQLAIAQYLKKKK